MNHGDEPSLRQKLQEAARQRTVMDVGAQRVARVYAEALLGAAGQRGQAQEVLEELDSLVEDVFAADPSLEAFLAGGAVSRKRKADLIRRVFGGRASELFLNFLLVLNDHDRLGLLRDVLREYRGLFDSRAGRFRARVVSAVPLADDQRERLRQQLRESFRGEPVVEEEVDPDLLGGLVVRVGDWVYDSSVRTRLQTLEN